MLSNLPPGARLIPGFRLTRLNRHIEAVVVTDRAVLAFARDAATAEAAAIDLADFHEGCRGVPVLPIALVQGERVTAQRPLPFPGAARPMATTRLLLPALFRQVAAFPPVPGFDPAAWEHAAYRPVPALLAAACRLYAHHDDARLRLASASHGDLERTRATVAALIAGAEARQEHRVVFVTGHPGAGKTLCGLDLAFDPAIPAAFLTGNPALLHVLRAALVRDAACRGLARRAAGQRVHAVIQPLHHFRDHHVASPAAPPDRVLVVDEAQRCWTAEYATRKTLHKATKLTQSEPATLLDIMARKDGWAVIVCLLGGGQEIHAGEGGLAGWSEALATRPAWRAYAPPHALTATDPRQRLHADAVTLDAALHLGQPVRAHRAPRLVAWVDAVLANEPEAAARIAGDDLPVRLTRSLAALRAGLRAQARGRSGLVASAAGRRLRAEGLGGLLWHQDEDAVARWFLDPWPDIRSSDALEVAATEFGVQGLELDHIGLCWDIDLARTASGWEPQAFRATAWTRPKTADTLSNKVNAYRVLLTRARKSTTIWVPQGDARDPTRDPARYDAIAAYLHRCGAPALDDAPQPEHHARPPELALL